MATGDQQDLQSRLLSLLPPWFPSGAAPVLGAAFAAAAWAGSFVYGLIQYARSQARIATATGGWLDLIAFDFFQRAFVRPVGWTDAQMRAQILFRVLNPAGTRPGLIAGIENLTGRAPIVIEPWNTGDCGAWSDGSLTTDCGPIGWDAGGAWGELDLPNQLFIQVFRSNAGGVATVEGWASVADTVATGGWSDGSLATDFGAIEWIDLADAPGQVSDSLIYQTVTDLMAAGCVAWVAIEAAIDTAIYDESSYDDGSEYG